MPSPVRLLRGAFPKLPILAGNVTSAAGVEFLAQCGANTVKVGQGPGSICTTRVVAGVGIPQLTALYVASRAAAKAGVSILADGGITKSGDLVKALTLAHGVVCGGLFAGCGGEAMRPFGFARELSSLPHHTDHQRRDDGHNHDPGEVRPAQSPPKSLAPQAQFLVVRRGWR